jgi:hypothetical protein
LAKLNLNPAELAKLRELARSPKYRKYLFLGFSLDLNTAQVSDLLSSSVDVSKSGAEVLTILLSHYSQAKQAPTTGKLTKFKDLPGGYAYEGAFIHRTIEPVEEAFGEKPTRLIEAAKALGGKSLNLGDASVEVPALEGVPITYILWASGEFEASATVLFDESASSFLPTEDLAVLGELTTYRLKKANDSLNAKRI